MHFYQTEVNIIGSKLNCLSGTHKIDISNIITNFVREATSIDFWEVHFQEVPKLSIQGFYE